MVDRYISDEWKLAQKGHSLYDFIDIKVNDDNLLFLDPSLIEGLDNQWGKAAVEVMQSFFDNLFESYIKGDKKRKTELLAHAGEQNATKLGYGNGYNGKGNTANGLLNVFIPLERLVNEITTINKPQDLPVLIPGFAEDGMSDLLTNVLHLELSDFTALQMKKYGVEENGDVSFHTWSKANNEWILIKRPGYLVNGKEILLVPKNIVRKNYLFGTGQYFTRIIVERIREDGGYYDNDGKAIPKKDIVKSFRFSGEHWMYNKVIQYTKEHNDALLEYHKRIPLFYNENGYSMSDEELDEVVYGYIISKSA